MLAQYNLNKLIVLSVLLKEKAIKFYSNVGSENLSKYKINKLLHGKCFVLYALVFVPENSLVRYAHIFVF